MYQSVDLIWKIAVKNVGCIFAYFCGGQSFRQIKIPEIRGEVRVAVICN